MAGEHGRSPAPEGPTEELPVIGERHPANWRASADIREFGRLAAAVHAHERTSCSPGTAVTAADRRLYSTLARLEQPN